MGYTLRNTYKYQGKYYGPGDNVNVPLGLAKSLNLEKYIPPDYEPEPEPLFTSKHVGGGWYEIHNREGMKVAKVQGKDDLETKLQHLNQVHDSKGAVQEIQNAMPLSEDRELPPTEQLDAEAHAPFLRPSPFASEAELNPAKADEPSEEPQEPAEEVEPTEPSEDAADSDSERQERK